MPGEPHSTYPFIAFLMMTTSVSVVYSWLYNASKQRLIVALFFHAMSNTAAPLIPYLVWEEGKPETAYWVYAGVNVVAAVIFGILTYREKTTNN
jgi:membrane protease YdiL (CAAX protease family)